MNVSIIKFKQLYINERKQILVEAVFTPWNAHLAFPCAFSSLPPNFTPISPYPQSQRNSYYCFFFFSHYVTVRVSKGNTTHFESTSQLTLTIGHGLVKFNSLYMYTDH